MVCKDIVCKDIVCKDIVCKDMVCKDIVCKDMVCGSYSPSSSIIAPKDGLMQESFICFLI